MSRIWAGLCRLALIIAVALSGACERGAPTFRATDVTGASFGRNFELVDHTGKARKLADFRGKVVVLFFGFTHCPDVCPTTLAELAGALKHLGPEAERVQVLMVTVDPQRDTPEILSAYVTAFNAGFLGLSGTEKQIADVAREFKVIYQKVEGSGADNYTMDHSAGTFIFDTQGRLRLYFGYGQRAEAYAHDIEQLLRAA